MITDRWNVVNERWSVPVQAGARGDCFRKGRGATCIVQVGCKGPTRIRSLVWCGRCGCKATGLSTGVRIK